jgi:hypothetical protein
MSLVSTVTARGHMRFMIEEKHSVKADVVIEFLKRLTVGAKIFLIGARGLTHIAKKTKQFVASLGGVLQLFLSSALLARPKRIGLDAFQIRYGRAHPTSRTIRSFFQKPSLRYAA